MRSAFAAQTLADLGYPNAVSMAGGFGRWKDEGREWKKPVGLSPDQRDRYQRHLLLPEVGVEGQAKLLASKVLMLGAGGLGSPAALYLAAAGVGTIGIVDMDEVDASNLQRQILHNLDRIGDRKVDSAKKTLTAMNPDVDVVTYDTRLSADNVLELLDGLRRRHRRRRQLPQPLPAQRRVGEARHPGRPRLDLPVRGHGHRVRSPSGDRTTATWCRSRRRRSWRRPAPRPACWACCPGIIGSLQALEAIKLLLGLGDPLIGRILSYDALEQTFREYKLRVDPTNPVTYENRDRIQIRELDGLCAPWVEDHSALAAGQVAGGASSIRAWAIGLPAAAAAALVEPWRCWPWPAVPGWWSGSVSVERRWPVDRRWPGSPGAGVRRRAGCGALVVVVVLLAAPARAAADPARAATAPARAAGPVRSPAGSGARRLSPGGSPCSRPRCRAQRGRHHGGQRLLPRRR